MLRKALKPAALCVGTLVLAGCTNIWRDNFVGAPIDHYPPTETVDLREVPWSRIDRTLAAIERERAASDVHWKDWSEQRLLEEHERLLKGLQISEDPEDIIVLGRSVFRSVQPVSPYAPELEGFASELGADYAVWSSSFVGKSERVIQEPITRSGVRPHHSRDGSGVDRHSFAPWSETIYVPIVVEANEYAWVVYYLRRRD